MRVSPKLSTWKTACIVPIPKRPVISSMNDLRPVALASAVMKVCKRVVLCKLEKSVKEYIYSLQFACTGKTGELMMRF